MPGSRGIETQVHTNESYMFPSYSSVLVLVCVISLSATDACRPLIDESTMAIGAGREWREGGASEAEFGRGGRGGIGHRRRSTAVW